MHYHLEIIMPPVEDVETAVSEIMSPFDENRSFDDDDFSGYPFWDWWVIGGRWAGTKFQQSVDQEKLDSFYAELKERKVTVLGLQCGKQELTPESQIPMVDALWKSCFPSYPGKHCPLFRHSNDPYNSNDCQPFDVMPLSLVHPDVTASHVIFARKNYDDSKYEAKYMLQTEIWNGVNHVKAEWSGCIADAVRMYGDHIKGYHEDVIPEYTPDDNWLCVTVDYHS